MNTSQRFRRHGFSFRSQMLLAFVACVAAGLPEGASADEAFARSTVFEAGKEGYNVFRIPAVIKAANGNLLAFCEARAGGDASEIDLVMKRSVDGGQTWGALSVVQESEDFRELFAADGPPITIGNPAPVVDLLDENDPGRIWLPYTLENDRVFVVSSDDHGVTWSVRREITDGIKKPEWGWYATGPVHSIQLQHGKHRGRLVVPCDHRIGDDGADRGALGAHAVISDDHGKTWTLGAVDDTYDDGINANETTVVELNDGRLYFNTRSQNGADPATRGEAISNDGGQTFTPVDADSWKQFSPAPAVLDPPVVQSSLLRVSSETKAGGMDLILFCGPDQDGPTGKGRSDLRLRYTIDEAVSWHDGPLLHTGPAAYSDMVMIQPEEIGVLFECGDATGRNAYQRIDFLRLSASSVIRKAAGSSEE